ncbi:MAG: MCE family protein [Leptolyngbyaceae cyanobacterium SM2_3_12]|nr:MCE family protein [Leptolyngbyaceae cyanobacterium SM2_3_12]
MRARAIREGSVGLLILIAVGLFGGLVLWLRGLNPRQSNYRATFVFENTLGMQEGGRCSLSGGAGGASSGHYPFGERVMVAVDIASADLRIPSDALIQANQSGLIGETTIDITPVEPLLASGIALSPVGPDCNSEIIICNGDQLRGEVGASFESLIRSAEELASAFADPEIVNDLKTTLKTATVLTENFNELTQELTTLSQQVQAEVDPFVTSANRATANIADAAAQFEVTGSEVNSLIANNRSSIVSTLENLNRSSADLEIITATLAPAIQDSDLIQNLDQLSANATLAIADIQAITSTVNTPENLVILQQTLDSARIVFQSAQKVLADVDDLTGDPVLRQNIRNLINGLTTLLSLTNQLEQDSRLAETLTLPSGQPLERITLTPVPLALARQEHQGANSAPLVVSPNGQYYRVHAHPLP